MKRRIAVILHGGVGTGHFGQGYPVLTKILEQLSHDFDIHVFSHALPYDRNVIPVSIKFTSPPQRISHNLFRWFSLFWLLFTTHRRDSFHLFVAFWGYPAGALTAMFSKICRVPYIVYLLGGDSAGVPRINYGILHKPIIRKFVKWAYTGSNSAIILSGYQAKELARFGIERKFVVIPWGVDLSAFTFSKNAILGPLKIIHVGHLTPVKDQVTLLKTFSLVRKQVKAVLNIFGVDAGMKEKLVSLCKELNIFDDVRFNEMVPYEQMADMYADAHLMIHTSLSEGQSLAVTEAAASGVLLAGTKVGLLYDLTDEEAIRVDVGDYQRLSDNILAVISSNEEWNSKVKKARAWCENHDLIWTVNEIKNEFDRIISLKK